MKKISVGTRNTQFRVSRKKRAARPLAAPRRAIAVDAIFLQLSALLGLSLNGVPGGLHGLLRVRFLALEVFLPLGLTDLELGESELLIRDRLGHFELGEHQRYPVLPPVGLGLVPLVVIRLIRRNLARVGRRAAGDGILPDAVVEGQRLHVFGGLVLVLAVLE